MKWKQFSTGVTQFLTIIISIILIIALSKALDNLKFIGENLGWDNNYYLGYTTIYVLLAGCIWALVSTIINWVVD